ncbi:MAG TPA: hypothetical protein VF177_14500 [Anaerolineae bacterium]
MGDFEEEYQDVLQNIEFALVQVYREHDDMTDWEAEQAINGLIRTYTAEERSRSEPNLRLQPLAEEAYDRVVAMCEWRLGRTQLVDESGEEVDLLIEPVTVSEMVDCLKRVRRSIQMWRKEGGRRGYFEFVGQFLP